MASQLIKTCTEVLSFTSLVGLRETEEPGGWHEPKSATKTKSSFINRTEKGRRCRAV